MKNGRQKQILELLQKNGYMRTTNLAKLLYSSLPTIRRDLIDLEKEGYIVRNHGGAMLAPDNAVLPVSYRRSNSRSEKQHLCDAAKEYIKDYQTIFIDESTTLLFLARHLKSLKNAVIITNSIDAMIELRGTESSVYCTGGIYCLDSNLMGYFTEDFISKFNIDVALFSSGAMSRDGEISDAGEYKNGLVRTLLKHSEKCIYICDKSKIDISARYNIANVSEVSLVITDSEENSLNIPPEKVIYCK